MKLTPAVIPCAGLRLLAVSLTFCAILVRISAIDEDLVGKRPEEDLNSNQVSSDDDDTGEKHSSLYRGRRAVKNNAIRNQDFEKRLKAMEKRLYLYSSVV